MLRIVRVVLRDGRELEIAQEVDEGSALTAEQMLAHATVDGRLRVSDSNTVGVEEVACVELVRPHAPAGPGWGPGLQDEDAAAAASSGYEDP